MNLRLSATILISKTVMFLSRITRYGGTSLPGLVAGKLYPDIIKVMTRGFNIIMVTGTNGKTTTARIIGKILEDNGIPYIANKSGANMSGGVISTFIEAADLRGRFAGISTALIEIDEAAFRNITRFVEPGVLVVTNFFRDQLDRYGELYTTLEGVREGMANVKTAAGMRAVLNADDSLCASLGRDTDKPVTYFGLDDSVYSGVSEVKNTDAMFCIFCKTKYEYSNHIYGHLGHFSCPGCGYSRPDADVLCSGIDERTGTHSRIRFSYPRENGAPEFSARVNLPGLYNIYNSLAAAACAKVLGLPEETTAGALAAFESGFGRMEGIDVGGRHIKVILVKNPTGFNQVIEFLRTDDRRMEIAFIINDRFADGRDISWLWDVDFEKLADVVSLTGRFYTSGIRAEDMAVRLKYAGIPAASIETEKSYGALIDTALARLPEGGTFYILPTYTALLDVRRVLADKFKLKEFWK